MIILRILYEYTAFVLNHAKDHTLYVGLSESILTQLLIVRNIINVM